MNLECRPCLPLSKLNRREVKTIVQVWIFLISCYDTFGYSQYLVTIWIFLLCCYNTTLFLTFSSKLWYWWAGNQLLKQLVSFRVESREENQMMSTEKTTLVSNEIDIQWPSFPQALDRFLGSDQTWGKIVSSSYFPAESKRKMPFSPSSGKWPIWVF